MLTEWHYARIERQHRAAVERGEPGALLRCISHYFSLRRPVPQWAQDLLNDAVLKADCYEIKSWDEIFGRPIKKGKQQAAARREQSIAEHLFYLITEHHHEGGVPISKGIFETVGKSFGISGTTAERIYYKESKIFEEHMREAERMEAEHMQAQSSEDFKP